MLEVLHCSLVLLGFFPRIERSEIFAFAGPGIFLSRVEPVLTRLQFSNHKTPHLEGWTLNPIWVLLERFVIVKPPVVHVFSRPCAPKRSVLQQVAQPTLRLPCGRLSGPELC
jgi:hypothetical protein